MNEDEDEDEHEHEDDEGPVQADQYQPFFLIHHQMSTVQSATMPKIHA